MDEDLITLTITNYEKQLLIDAITTSHLPTKRSLGRLLKILKNS